jgi:hypothetical protein
MEPLPPVNPKIIAVNFRPQAKPGERILGIVSEDATVAVSAEQGGADGATVGLSVMLVSGPGAYSLEDRRKTEDWLKGGKASPAVGDALMQSDQIRLRGDRALVVAGPAHIDDYLLGLAAFAYHETQIVGLEADLADRWRRLGEDIPLTETIRMRDLDRQAAVDALVGDLTRIRMHLVVVDQTIYRPASALSPPAHRLLNELALTSRHADRLEVLGERLEVLEETYERISERMLELSLHRREMIVEWAIALLLLVETLALVYPLIR